MGHVVNGWRDAWRRGLISGSLASILSAIALAACDVIEGKATSAGPLNGPSQWVWGRHAAHQRRLRWRYTAVGYGVHHVASIGWAVLHEKHVAGPLDGRVRPVQFLAAAGTAAPARGRKTDSNSACSACAACRHAGPRAA